MTVKDLKDILVIIPEDFNIQFNYERKLTDNELQELTYKYPFENVKCEYDGHDVGYSDKTVIFYIMESEENEID